MDGVSDERSAQAELHLLDVINQLIITRQRRINDSSTHLRDWIWWLFPTTLFRQDQSNAPLTEVT